MTASVDRPAMLWFRATLPAGEATLGLPEAVADASAPPLLRAAMRLADAEGLILALEAWTGEALDWRPLDDAAALAARLAQGVSFEVVGETPAAPVGTCCVLPLRAIGRRVAVPPLFRGDACRWRRVELQVELDAFDLPEAQQARLAPGRVMLLPGSFDPAWRVHLCNAALGLRLPTRWTAQRVLALDNGVAPQRAGALRARLLRTATMNPGALLGFGGPAVAEIDETPDADWQAVIDDAGGGPVIGRLMPALGGHALRLH